MVVSQIHDAFVFSIKLICKHILGMKHVWNMEVNAPPVYYTPTHPLAAPGWAPPSQPFSRPTEAHSLAQLSRVF